MNMIENKLLPGTYNSAHSLEENLNKHVRQIRSDYIKLCDLEKDVITITQDTTSFNDDNVVLYKKTLALIAHKTHCLEHQIKIIKENSEIEKTTQKIKELRQNNKKSRKNAYHIDDNSEYYKRK